MFPPLPSWIRRKLIECRNRGGCGGRWQAYPDGLPNTPRGTELLADPEFNDPSAWNTFTISPWGLQYVDVSGGQANFGESMSNLGIGVIRPASLLVGETGKTYQITIEIGSFTTADAVTKIRFANEDLWSHADGAGVFKYEITPAFPTGYLWILGRNALFSVERISILEMP